MGLPIGDEGKAVVDCAEIPRSCVWNCCLHVEAYDRQQFGELVRNNITNLWNGVDENGWRGLIYFNPAPLLSGELRSWPNRNPNRALHWMTPKGDQEMIDWTENVFNCLSLCRGNIARSWAASWGHAINHSRLFQPFSLESAVMASGTLESKNRDRCAMGPGKTQWVPQ